MHPPGDDHAASPAQPPAQSQDAQSQASDRFALRNLDARAIALGGIAIVAFVVALAFVWYASTTLLVIFAGILLGLFLNALARLIAFLRLPYALRLTFVCIFLAAIMTGAFALGGKTVAQQTSLLTSTLRAQMGNIKIWLEERGVDPGLLDFRNQNTAPDSNNQPKHLPGPSSLPSGTGTVISQTSHIIVSTISAVGNVFVILFLGVLFAAQPQLYRDGFLRFVPPERRMRARQALEHLGESLNRWLIGQIITMCAIFAVVWIGLALIGIPGAFILGFQAGLLAFIPTLGALISGAIIILASLSSGWFAVAYAATLYIGVQILESYILTPFIQRHAIDIPPATIFAAQILLGVLFGIWGLALALPLVVVIKVMLNHYYLNNNPA